MLSTWLIVERRVPVSQVCLFIPLLQVLHPDHERREHRWRRYRYRQVPATRQASDVLHPVACTEDVRRGVRYLATRQNEVDALCHLTDKKLVLHAHSYANRTGEWDSARWMLTASMGMVRVMEELRARQQEVEVEYCALCSMNGIDLQLRVHQTQMRRVLLDSRGASLMHVGAICAETLWRVLIALKPVLNVCNCTLSMTSSTLGTDLPLDSIAQVKPIWARV